MYSIALFVPRISKGFSCFCVVSRTLCSRSFNRDDVENGFGRIEEFLNESWKSEHNTEGKTSTFYDSLGSRGNFPARQNFVDEVKTDAARILEILYQDGPGFDAKPALSDLGVRVSGLLVREVLFYLLKTVNYVDEHKNRVARLGYKFFVWSGEQAKYKHQPNVYHIMMKIFAETQELKAMFELLDEMIEKRYPITARTFNILICTCGSAGLARKVVERFIKSKTFNYRPFKDSFNAILHSLVTLNQYRLVEWVYEQMLVEEYKPNVLTYNIIMFAKFRLGKLDDVYRLLDEMAGKGFELDIHTLNILLHVLGKGDKPDIALKLLNHMKKVGKGPSVLHFTTLIDGLSRAGNLDASQYFFDEMIKHGCVPDVVCYTVMITSYVVWGKLDKAREIFDEMIRRGQLPNVFTYNSMIRGLCMVRKFKEAKSMLIDMEKKGCKPNYLVYTTLVGYLRNAGKLSDANEVINHMKAKGQYTHRESDLKYYCRSKKG